MTEKSFWNSSEDGCNLGKISIKRIVDLERVPFSLDLIFPNIHPDEIQKIVEKADTRKFSDQNLSLLLSFHSFLIQTGKHNILVDTCCGNDKNRPERPVWHNRNGPFIQNLAATGLSPLDIDFVLCTHLHADHVGWNTKLADGKWIPTFPNAQYIFAQKELDYWQAESIKNPAEPIMYGSYDDSVLPVVTSGQALLINGEYHISDGINTEPAPGHTPGNMILHVENNNEKAILCGDVIHHPIQLAVTP